MLDRSTPPPVGQPSAVTFPEVTRRRLENGLRVWALEASSVPTVTVAFLVNAGTSADPPERPGLASLTSALVTEGAGPYDSIQLADALTRIGGQLTTEVGTDAATLTLSVLARHFERGLAILADIVRRPRLAAPDFERVRDLRLSRLKQVSRTPAAAADRALLTAVYGDHPYGHGALGTTRVIEQTSLDDARRFWETRWTPGQATVLVAGDVPVTAAHVAVSAVFSDAAVSRSETPVVLPPVFQPVRDVRVVHRADAPQSEIRVGHLGPARLTPDYHALVTLNAILGGQFTSRINRNLRETRAITYGARSAFDMRRISGMFSCDSSVQADATGTALAEVLREMRAIAGEGAIAFDELDHARASLTRGYVRHFETAPQLARSMAELAAHDLPDDTFDRFVPEIEKLTVQDLTTAARTTLHPDDAALVVVGDLEVVGKGLEALGRPVTEVTPEF